jgi:hypothetical protein
MSFNFVIFFDDFVFSIFSKLNRPSRAEQAESLPTGKNIKEICELANNPRKTFYQK